MNCHDCRKHLHPYLDSELEVQQNLDILQHLNACSECARIFEVEESSWEHVQRALQVDDGPSDSFRAGIPSLLANVDRRETWRRAMGYIVPLGIAAAFLIYMQVTSGADNTDIENVDPPVITRDGPKHPPGLRHDHGPGIEFAVGQFLGGSGDKGSRLLSKKFLDTHGEFTELDAEAARTEYLKLMGPSADIPSALRGKRIHGAMADAEFGGTNVHSLILSDHKDQIFGLYVVDRRTAGVDDMHDLGSEGMRDDFRLDRCKSCNVITVTSGDRVFIFVTHHIGSVKPMIDMVRETF